MNKPNLILGRINMPTLPPRAQKVHTIYKELAQLEVKIKSIRVDDEEYGQTENLMVELKKTLQKEMNEICPIIRNRRVIT